MSFRTQGTAALATVLNNKKNIGILERAVYEKVAKGREEEDDYKCAIYQVLSDVQAQKSIKDIYRSIRVGELGWKHHSFCAMAQRIAEQNEFIENPFEVEEGVHTCQKCGSKRVFSYNKQVMGGDEGTSVFCECVACHCKWKEKG
jgi:DNA-directed RNA polymerase subunit M/transcription elongation factor TFIIS